jgi:hypothetical protein
MLVHSLARAEPATRTGGDLHALDRHLEHPRCETAPLSDIAAEVAAMQADVIVLQKSTSDTSPDSSTPAALAAALGYYACCQHQMGRGRLRPRRSVPLAADRHTLSLA